MSKHLISFHIGPVQDFIAIARRTQDLWLGSWLLSHLSRSGIEAGLSAGAGLVAPAPPFDSDDPSFDPADANTTNHFILRVADTDARTLAQTIEAGVRQEWERIQRATRREFFQDVEDGLWLRQVSSLLDIFWAVVPDDGSSHARKRAQDALDARKRLRNFEPVTEPHLKCSLCGLRQELSNQHSFWAAKSKWQRHTRQYRGRLRVYEDGSERLCAVCAVKRSALTAGALRHAGLTRTDGQFPSTSSIAAATFKQALLENGKADAELGDFLAALQRTGFSDADRIEASCLPGLAALADTISTPRRDWHEGLLRFDGDLFYREIFVEKKFEKEFPNIIQKILQRGVAEELGDGYTAKDLLELEPQYVSRKLSAVAATLDALYRTGDAPPSKYYVALAMDGDHMGAFFGSVDEATARKLSHEMARFARSEAKQIVNQHFGRLVYAGGDDLLALLPLATALRCARELQRSFKEAVGNAIAGIVVPDAVRVPTPSTGLAIAHHTSPLDLTLQAMRRAEVAAKQTYGRDALCVHVLKRSGEEVRVGTRWAGSDINQPDWLESFDQLVNVLRDEVLSMKFTTAVVAEASGLAMLPVEAQQSELGRLAKRQRGAKFDQSLNEADIRELMNRLAAWAKTQIGGNDKRPLGLEEVAQWILLARFIAGGGSSDE
jgi:CRISPR-associated protein Cmr2